MRTFTVRQLAVAAILGSFGGAASLAQAAPVLWTGGGDGVSWTDGNNWLNSSPPMNSPPQTPPADNNYTDQGAEFNAVATSITVPTLQQVSGLQFDTAGWALNSAQIDTGPIISNGVGTNTISGVVNYSGGTDANGYISPATWHVGIGNTLAVGTMYLNNATVILDGGGQVTLTSEGIWGWGTANDVNIDNATLQINYATPYYQPDSASGVITLENPGESFVDLQTTVANTETYFGSEIVGNGGTLEATDLGNGYTQVGLVAAPEPSTVGLLTLAAVGGLWRRRRRA
ncbi:MAG TPA: PEP-CTERM sorting domain-containing protein [Tepidisphaeraceae bacterium]|jgi:hypothetical protein|nr:PEP-CTERM sorting domain-containing protein [Tepidisphaeraceae bacterium]